MNVWDTLRMDHFIQDQVIINALNAEVKHLNI
jgi:hypothetical protein